MSPFGFVTCNCPVGMKYHALNCPVSPGEEQALPAWAIRKECSNAQKAAIRDQVVRPLAGSVHARATEKRRLVRLAEVVLRLRGEQNTGREPK